MFTPSSEHLKEAPDSQRKTVPVFLTHCVRGEDSSQEAETAHSPPPDTDTAPAPTPSPAVTLTLLFTLRSQVLCAYHLRDSAVPPLAP